MIRPRTAAFLVSVATGFLWGAVTATPEPPAAPPAEAERTLEVTGVGVERARLGRMTLRGRLAERSEIAEDALEELVAGRASSLAKVVAGAVPNLAVSTAGVRVFHGAEVQPNPNRGFVVVNGQLVSGGDAEGGGARFEDEVALEVSGLETFGVELIEHTAARLVDAALGAGLKLAPKARTDPYGNPTPGPATSLIEFALADPPAAERAALGRAIADARRRGAELAELAGVALGPVRRIVVAGVSCDWDRLSEEAACRAEIRVVFDVR